VWFKKRHFLNLFSVLLVYYFGRVVKISGKGSKRDTFETFFVFMAFGDDRIRPTAVFSAIWISRGS